MASLRQIRSRIKSVQNSKQIMRAMQLVSGSKLKRAQDKLIQGRVVVGFLDAMLDRVLANDRTGFQRDTLKQHVPLEPGTKLTHPLATVREGGESALVVITSDTGLCGSYNTNLIQLTEAHLRRESAQPTQLIFIGKRAHRHFTKRGYQPVDAYLDLAGRPNPAKSEAIGRSLMERFLSGQVSSVSVLYSKFLSATTYQPTIQQWLPISISDITPGGSDIRYRGRSPAISDIGRVEYIFEPSAEALFGKLLPRWALAKFQLILLEAFTSEHSARMIAMKNATDNAQELLTGLTMQRNKIRQAAITKELSEIVGTVEALK